MNLHLWRIILIRAVASYSTWRERETEMTSRNKMEAWGITSGDVSGAADVEAGVVVPPNTKHRIII